MGTVVSQMAEPDIEPETQVSCLLWSDSEEMKWEANLSENKSLSKELKDI
jgi:hypothetical protein